MLDVEAARLCQILLCKESVSPLLNLGSSTREFREVTKPHIERNLFEPLRRAGVAVFHSDLKDADGVDIPGDALNPAVMRDLKAREFKCILVANLLEHVRDRQRVAARRERDARPVALRSHAGVRDRAEGVRMLTQHRLVQQSAQSDAGLDQAVPDSWGVGLDVARSTTTTRSGSPWTRRSLPVPY